MPDLSAVVVNFNSLAYLERLVPDLLAQEFEVDGHRGTLEVIVVDNASPEDDPARLIGLASDPRVRLVRNARNVGYALANRQGLAVARGAWHLVTNPDVQVRPGCLRHLIQALEGDAGAAMAGPLSCMDEGGEILLPPNELPDPWTENLVHLARRHDAIARFRIRRRTRAAHAYWTATTPIRLPMLSGGFFLARRRTLEDLDFFDPGYPLYYEDTDLFRRCQARGFGLLHVPAARIVHHFSRSTFSRVRGALHRNRLGRERYFTAHFGPRGRRTLEAALRRGDQLARDAESPFPLMDLGERTEPPEIPVPDHPGVLLEVAGNARFSLSVGVYPRPGHPWRWPRDFWAGLAPTRYWCRAADPRSGETIAAWSVFRCPNP